MNNKKEERQLINCPHCTKLIKLIVDGGVVKDSTFFNDKKEIEIEISEKLSNLGYEFG
jgi:hypothetical protein